jgi:ParB family transcriptional regulator, chromosome partitioning protein
MVTRRPKTSAKERFSAATTTAAAMHIQDMAAATRSDLEREQAAYAPLDAIIDRNQDTRPLNPIHVENLAESIAVLGLLEPLVVDLHSRLLAGGHRKAAIMSLRISNPNLFEKQFPNEMVPVRIMPFDADDDPERALQCEIAENEKRRDYTNTEIKSIAEKLKQAGFVALKGRPKRGQKALMPALSVVVGKSIRRIQQYMENPDNAIESKADESTKLFVLLKRANRSLSSSREIIAGMPKTTEIQITLKNILKQLDEILNSLESR